MPPEGSAWLPRGKCSVRREVIPELLHELWRKHFDLRLVRLLLAEQHQLDHTARRGYRVSREGVEALICHVIDSDSGTGLWVDVRHLGLQLYGW
jgi:hypothetical protein